MKQFLKTIIPNKVWKLIRELLIIQGQNKTAIICDSIINNYTKFNSVQYAFSAKKALGNKPIIWQYWGQGYENVPELVSICLKSVEKYKGDYIIIRLTDENLSEYIDLPDFVNEKRKLFSCAFFSDLLRCILLSTYGGVWLDATVLLTGPLPKRYFDYDFFLFQRDKNELNQDYWENSFAHYYGWQKNFKVKMLSSVFFAKKKSLLVTTLTQLLLIYWKNETKLHHYFFFQILFEQLISQHPEWNCPVESDCVPHIIQQIINADYQEVSFKQVIQMTSIHKLSYKDHNAVRKLKVLLNDYYGFNK